MVTRIRTLLETRQLTPTQFADVIGVARPIVSHILSGRNKPSLEVVQRILAAMPDLSMPWLLNGTGPMQAAAGAAPAVGAALVSDLAAAAPSAPVAAAPVSQASETEERAYYKSNALISNDLKTEVPVNLPASAPAPAARQQFGGQLPAPASVPFLATASPAAASKARPVPRRFAPLPKPNYAPVGVLTPLPAPTPVVPAPTPTPTPVSSPVVSAPIEVPVEACAPVEAISALPEAPARELAAGLPLAPPSSDATAAALFAGSEKPIRRIVIFYRDGSFADYQPE